MTEKQTKSIDQATVEMIDKACEEKVRTVFDRAEAMRPCPIGSEGSCCSNWCWDTRDNYGGTCPADFVCVAGPSGCGKTTCPRNLN